MAKVSTFDLFACDFPSITNSRLGAASPLSIKPTSLTLSSNSLKSFSFISAILLPVRIIFLVDLCLNPPSDFCHKSPLDKYNPFPMRDNKLCELRRFCLYLSSANGFFANRLRPELHPRAYNFQANSFEKRNNFLR